MDVPPLTESEFQLQFQNLDQDQDGLISFEDFKVYILLNQGNNNITGDQLTIEDISYINQLFAENKGKSLSQLKSIAKREQKIEVFEKFFDGYNQEDIQESAFNQRVEYFENAIFGLSQTEVVDSDLQVQDSKKFLQTSDQQNQVKKGSRQDTLNQSFKNREASQANDLNLSSRSRDASGITQIKTQSEQIIGICIGYLTEVDNTQYPENKIQDVFNLLLDNPSTISQQDWPIFINNLANVHKQVLQRIGDYDDSNQRLRRDLELQEAETQDAKQQYLDCKQILTGMETEYQKMQNQISEILPKYQMLNQLKQRNQNLTQQLFERNNEIGNLKSELFASQQQERDVKIKFQELEEKLLDTETELRQVKDQLRGGGGTPSGLRKTKLMDRGTLAFGKTRQTAMQSFLKRSADFNDRDQSTVDNQELIDQEELTEALEQNYLKQLAQLANQSKLSSIEKQSLQGIIQQYEIYKSNWETALEEAEEAAQELENLEATVEKLTQEVEYQKKISADDRKQLELVKAQYEQLKIERDQLQSELETLQLELIQGDLFAKAGLVSEITKIKGQDSVQTETQAAPEQNLKPTNKLEELQSKNLQTAETVDELNFARASQYQDDYIQSEGRETYAPFGNYYSALKPGQLDQIQEMDEYRESAALSVAYDDQENNQEYYQEQEQEFDIQQQQNQIEDTDQQQINQQVPPADEAIEDQNMQQQHQQEVVVQEQDVEVVPANDATNLNSQQDTIEQQNSNFQEFAGVFQQEQRILSFNPAQQPEFFHQESTTTNYFSTVEQQDQPESSNQQADAQDVAGEEFNPTQDDDVEEEKAVSDIRQTAVRLTKQGSIRVTESKRRVTMREEETKKDTKKVLEVSDDSDEYGDQVDALPGVRVSNALFDSTLETKDSVPAPVKSNSPRSEQKALTQSAERQGSVVKDLMNRSTNFINMQRQTLLNQSSKRKDFDYLNLRRNDHKQFAKVNKILQDHYETDQFVVFTDYIQQFDISLSLQNRIVLITAKSFFLLDKRFQFVKRELLRDLNEVILIKTNPGIFTLNFITGPPLIIQTFRRTELTVFLLTQRENMKLKTSIQRTKGINLTLKNGKTQKIYFDKQDTLKTSDSYQKKLLRNLQLNNFVNSLMCGYLEKLDYNFLGQIRWEEKFVVLTNVGLLYFSDPLKAPNDLFPILDCDIKKLQRGDEGYTAGYEAIRLVFSRKTVIFRCLSASDYDAWFKAIMTLQKQSEEKREEMKISEDRRLTMIARGLGVQVVK